MNRIVLLVVALFFAGCNWFNDLPRVTTLPVEEITAISAHSGGRVSDDGGEKVHTRGVMFSTRKDPPSGHITGITLDGPGNGEYTSSITGLKANTTYWVRAYAINANGTGYGNYRTFTTPQHSGPTVTDIDGNVYHTITIGHQVWMVENLKTTRFRDGTPIEYTTSNNNNWEQNVSGTYSWFENEVNNKADYGALYTFHAVNNSRGLCPEGWRVPASYQWQSLIYLVGDPDISGGILKERSVDYWKLPNTGATNDYGFTILPGGTRDYKGLFSQKGEEAMFWSSSKDSGYPVSFRVHFSGKAMELWKYSENYFFSVRCLKE
jgi:uncharacterized protein (TIGR02145 family)